MVCGSQQMLDIQSKQQSKQRVVADETGETMYERNLCGFVTSWGAEGGTSTYIEYSRRFARVNGVTTDGSEKRCDRDE